MQLEDDLAILRTRNNICYVQNLLGNDEVALHVAERLQRLLIRVADHVSESDAHDTLGDIYFSSGHYSQARYHYMHAIENARAGRVRLKEAWCLTGLAELEIASGRYVFAENHLERAQTLYQEEDHPRDRARLLAALGEYCWRTGRRAEAADYSLHLIEGLDEGGEG